MGRVGFGGFTKWEWRIHQVGGVGVEDSPGGSGRFTSGFSRPSPGGKGGSEGFTRWDGWMWRIHQVEVGGSGGFTRWEWRVHQVGVEGSPGGSGGSVGFTRWEECPRGKSGRGHFWTFTNCNPSVSLRQAARVKEVEEGRGGEDRQIRCEVHDLNPHVEHGRTPHVHWVKDQVIQQSPATLSRV